MSRARLRRKQTQRLQAAIQRHQTGRLDQAEAIYREVLTADPIQPDALHFLGMLLHQRGRNDEGLAMIRRATEIAPDYFDAFNNLGNVLRTANRVDEAEACYRRAIALKPHDANAYCNLGAVLNLRGEVEAAESACRKALELDSRHVGAYTNLGLVLKRQGRVRESIAACMAAVAYDPTHPEACKLLGLALCADGRIEDAREVYRRWSSNEPDNPVPRHLLAACAGADVPARASDGYVRSVFDGLADSFDEHLTFLQYQAPNLVAEAVARHSGEPKSALRVLDAGCGTGLCGSLLRPYASYIAGVDLSARMLSHAARLNLYDELLETELTSHLQSQPVAYDLIVCADTFCYFGDLRPAMQAAQRALRDSGMIVFTVEHDEAIAAVPGYSLAPHGRYAHATTHVRTALEQADLTCIELRPVRLRNEAGRPVEGLVVCARTMGSQSAQAQMQ